MRGRRHLLHLVGQRGTWGATEGKVVKDAEGRWRSPAGGPEGSVRVTKVRGFIGPVKASERPEGVTSATAAQVPLGTVVRQGDDLEAVDTGDPLLDGRYEVTEVQTGPAVLRLLLRRYAP